MAAHKQFDAKRDTPITWGAVDPVGAFDPRQWYTEKLPEYWSENERIFRKDGGTPMADRQGHREYDPKSQKEWQIFTCFWKDGKSNQHDGGEDDDRNSETGSKDSLGTVFTISPPSSNARTHLGFLYATSSNSRTLHTFSALPPIAMRDRGYAIL